MSAPLSPGWAIDGRCGGFTPGRKGTYAQRRWASVGKLVCPGPCTATDHTATQLLSARQIPFYYYYYYYCY
eukprot:5077831-Prorocentrum_lima.AAC.1